jgi:hypothetical protein
MRRELDTLNRLLHVEPPAELDALVRARMQAAVARHRQEGVYPVVARGRPWRAARREPSPLPRGEPRTRDERTALPFAERFVYATGLALYGIQAASIVVRLVWRTFAG